MKPQPTQMNPEKTLAIIFLAIGLFPWYKIYSWSRPLTAPTPSALRMVAYFTINILFIILGLRMLLPSKR
jgi:hypothetical protein